MSSIYDWFHSDCRSCVKITKWIALVEDLRLNTVKLVPFNWLYLYVFFTFIIGSLPHWAVKNRPSSSPYQSFSQNGSLFRVRYSCHFPADVNFHSYCALASLYLACDWSEGNRGPVWLDSIARRRSGKANKSVRAGQWAGIWDPVHHCSILYLNKFDEYWVWQRGSQYGQRENLLGFDNADRRYENKSQYKDNKNGIRMLR